MNAFLETVKLRNVIKSTDSAIKELIKKVDDTVEAWHKEKAAIIG